MEFLDYSQRNAPIEGLWTGMGISVLFHVLVFSMTLLSSWGGARHKMEMPFSMVSLISHEELGGMSAPSPGVDRPEASLTAPARDVAPRVERRSGASPAESLVPIRRLEVERAGPGSPTEIRKLDAPEIARSVEGLRRAPSVEKNLDALIPKARTEPGPKAIVQESGGGGAGSTARDSASSTTARSAPEQIGSGGSGERERPGTGSPQGTQMATAVLNVYSAGIKQAITRYWQLPETRIAGLETVIVVMVQKNGRVSSLHIEKKSGNALFDEAAVRAVRRAEPLAPFPEAIQANQLEFSISFRPEGLS